MPLAGENLSEKCLRTPADSPAGKRGQGVPLTPACPPSFWGETGVRGSRAVSRSIITAAILALLLPACSGSVDPAATDASTLAGLSGEAPKLAAEHFSRGEYGLAEQYYREAAEKAPKDAAVWIGLAASYDRLRRFDLADRAYAEAIKLSGETAQILNNQGYSYLLRGNLAAARAKLSKARTLEPDNPTLLNNLKLLEASAKYKAQ
jgi:Flp pilus assembly protein TadD